MDRQEGSRYDVLAERIFRALALLSEIQSRMAFTRPDAPGRSSSDPDRPPPGVVLTERGSPPSPAAQFARRYAGCRTDSARRTVLEDALAELRMARYAKMPKVDASTQEGRLLIGRDPRPARIVAYVYGYSERHIHRLRAEARKRSGVPSARRLP